MIIFLQSLILGVIAAFIGAFWIKLIKPGMIFSSIGKLLADIGQYIDYNANERLRTVQKRRLIKNSDGTWHTTFADPDVWDYKLPLWRKIANAFGCIYCVSTWISILMFSIVQIVTYEPFNVMWFVLGLFASIGITYITVLLIILVKSKIGSYEKTNDS